MNKKIDTRKNQGRNALANYRELRGTFTGVFERQGIKNGWTGPEKTILLLEIKDEKGQVLCDHLWFNYTKGFQSLGNLAKGDIIQFDARAKTYIKGYRGWRDDVWDKPVSQDWKLSFPTKLRKLGNDATDGDGTQRPALCAGC